MQIENSCSVIDAKLCIKHGGEGNFKYVCSLRCTPIQLIKLAVTAYPIDGILQVEEEEEENQSDNETYTIEDDVRQSRKGRGASGGGAEKGRKGSKRSYPRPAGRHGGARPKEVWTRPTDFSKWSRNGRKSRQEVKLFSKSHCIIAIFMSPYRNIQFCTVGLKLMMGL